MVEESLNPVLTTDTMCVRGRRNVSLRAGFHFFYRSEMLAESLAKPTSSFADVTQSACTTSKDVDKVTSCTCELLLNRQRSTKCGDQGRWIGVSAGLTTWTATAKSSI